MNLLLASGLFYGRPPMHHYTFERNFFTQHDYLDDVQYNIHRTARLPQVHIQNDMCGIE